MTPRRRFLFAVGSAIVLLIAWSAGPPSRAGRSDSTKARPPTSTPQASRRPARVHQVTPASAPAPTAAKTGIDACDDLVERSMTCAELPADAKIAIVEASKAWADLAAAGPRPDLEASCRATASVQGDALAAMGC